MGMLEQNDTTVDTKLKQITCVSLLPFVHHLRTYTRNKRENLCQFHYSTQAVKCFLYVYNGHDNGVGVVYIDKMK